MLMLLMKFTQPFRSCSTRLKKQSFLRFLQSNFPAIHVANMSTTNVALAKLKFVEKTKPVQRKKLISGTPPGTVYLQVLGAGANGSPCSVYLFTDQSRYLFNCGGGTQRLAHEHKTKISKLEQIFLTRNTWRTFGGLPGLSLTIQDSGAQQVGLIGPPHLETMFQSMRRFVVLKNMQVNTVDCTQTPHFEDSILSVKAVPLYSCAPADIEKQQVAVSYICDLKPRPGALILEKCVEYGVPPGPLLGQLKNGHDITLNDGRIVRSVDVTEPKETALCFVFIDIPTEDYLPALEKQADTFKALGPEVATVFHFTDRNVLENNRYRRFLEQNFEPQVEHHYLNSDKTNAMSGSVASIRLQYQLNQLEPRLFPLLADSMQMNSGTALSINLKKTKLTEDSKAQATNVDETIEGQPSDLNCLTIFHLRPKRGLDRSMEVKVTPEEYIQETRIIEGFTEELKRLRQDCELLPEVTAPAYPRITFLGTGSCIPNKTRNVSSLLVQTSANAYILFDCGEGTHGQIVRFFGEEKAKEVMLNLRIIYVSHLHADHHIGLIDLLNERQILQPSDKVLLLAPRQMDPWLQFYNENIESIQDAYTTLSNGKLLENPYRPNEKDAAFGIAAISTCLVRHCPHSFGVAVTLHETYEGKPIKITYSGDTMPCPDLIELGQDSTILIHEATMEDDLIEEAKAKTHSTISQAIQQGRDMQAMYTILTHFSQRYAKCPRMPQVTTDDEQKMMQNVSIAFDNMQVTLANLKHFHLLYPALYAMFVENTEDLEHRALKRELRQERKRKLEEKL